MPVYLKDLPSFVCIFKTRNIRIPGVYPILFSPVPVPAIHVLTPDCRSFSGATNHFGIATKLSFCPATGKHFLTIN
jgi:hypothetical protein